MFRRLFYERLSLTHGPILVLSVLFFIIRITIMHYMLHNISVSFVNQVSEN
jgi:hypothetical protein